MVKGGRPRIDLTNYQLELCRLFQEGLTFDQISAYLLETYQININTRTLKR
jgi:DNA-binding CsgD family transcriptional regulator